MAQLYERRAQLDEVPEEWHESVTATEMTRA